MGKNYISWRRVSTFKQNRSGLGLSAQADIIDYFVKRDGGNLIADYSECYTGKDLNGCVELRKAMAHAKREKAVLIIAKSDRFRNCQEALGVLDEMGDGNIEFCDIPHTDRFTLTLFFALAEREALIVSIRTKQALHALKERGDVKLGAANVKYQEHYKNKSMEEKLKSSRKRGQTKTERYLSSRNVTAFIKILKTLFPEATNGNITEWNWKCINTKDGVRQPILQMMSNIHEIDNNMFRQFDFSDIENIKLQYQLANMITSIKRSALKLQLFNNNNNSNN